MYQNRSGIFYAAWSKTTAALQSPDNAPQIQIFLGPTTKIPSSTQSADVASALKAFPDSDPFTKVDIFYFNRADLAASSDQVNQAMGDQEARKIFNDRGWAQLSSTDPIPKGINPLIHCFNSENCVTGEGWAGSNGVAYLGLAAPDEPYSSENEDTKVDAVEFYHALWQSYYVAQGSAPQTVHTRTNNVDNWFSPLSTPPFWLVVSGENSTIYDARGLGTYSNYETTMSSLLQNIGSVAPREYSVWGSQFDMNWLNHFLDISNYNITQENSWQNSNFSNDLSFSIGTYIYQVLVALKGPDFMYQLCKDMSQGQQFDQAFANVFGVTWEVAAPTLAKVIYDQYQNKS